MTDPIDAISALASAGKAADPVADEAAKAGAALWLKILGPPAEAIGTHFRAKIELWSEDNLARGVLKRAAQKVDATEPGTVPPRVAAEVFEKAQWADEEFVAEYLSGVLASARTPEGKDDRGVTWTAMVARLSSDALRLHYVIYSALRTKLLNEDTDVISEWNKKQLVFRYLDMAPRVDFGTGREWPDRLIAAAYTLAREGLITHMTHGGAEHLTGYPYGQFKLPTIGDMFITATTVEGCRLFLQAHGHGTRWAGAIGDATLPFDPWPAVAPSVADVPCSWLDDLERIER